VHMFLARRAREVTAPDPGDFEETEMLFVGLDELVATFRSGDIPVLSMAAAVALAAERIS
jgi:hypothetical protein